MEEGVKCPPLTEHLLGLCKQYPGVKPHYKSVREICQTGLVDQANDLALSPCRDSRVTCALNWAEYVCFVVALPYILFQVSLNAIG